VTPGGAGLADQFDDFGLPVVYVSRDTVSSGAIASVSLTVARDIRLFKSHYRTTVLSNKAIKIDGWSGRIVLLRGKDNGRTILIQHIVVAKGRVGYTLQMLGDNETAAADRALFKKIYGTWNAT
jgi:hypothetical protein